MTVVMDLPNTALLTLGTSNTRLTEAAGMDNDRPTVEVAGSSSRWQQAVAPYRQRPSSGRQYQQVAACRQ